MKNNLLRKIVPNIFVYVVKEKIDDEDVIVSVHLRKSKAEASKKRFCPNQEARVIKKLLHIFG